jgi:hypothetical protein
MLFEQCAVAVVKIGREGGREGGEKSRSSRMMGFAHKIVGAPIKL